MKGRFTATPLHPPSISFSSTSTAIPKSPSRPRSMTVVLRDRSKNRRPLQRGRNLSVEAIQTVQALKRANNKDQSTLHQVYASKFKRLLKLDMIAVLRELLRQNECVLALKVFEDIRNEDWYRPQLQLYAEMFTVFAGNGLFEQVKLLFLYLRSEELSEPQLEGFNTVFRIFINFSLSELAIECYFFMKEVGCEPDRSTFRILINGLESLREMAVSAKIREDAQKYYGESLEFLEEKEETSLASQASVGEVVF